MVAKLVPAIFLARGDWSGQTLSKKAQFADVQRDLDALADRLASKGIKHVLSSSGRQSVTTAEILSESLSAHLQVLDIPGWVEVSDTDRGGPSAAPSGIRMGPGSTLSKLGSKCQTPAELLATLAFEFCLQRNESFVLVGPEALIDVLTRECVKVTSAKAIPYCALTKLTAGEEAWTVQYLHDDCHLRGKSCPLEAWDDVDLNAIKTPRAAPATDAVAGIVERLEQQAITGAGERRNTRPTPMDAENEDEEDDLFTGGRRASGSVMGNWEALHPLPPRQPPPADTTVPAVPAATLPPAPHRREEEPEMMDLNDELFTGGRRTNPRKQPGPGPDRLRRTTGELDRTQRKTSLGESPYRTRTRALSASSDEGSLGGGFRMSIANSRGSLGNLSTDGGDIFDFDL